MSVLGRDVTNLFAIIVDWPAAPGLPIGTAASIYDHPAVISHWLQHRAILAHVCRAWFYPGLHNRYAELQQYIFGETPESTGGERRNLRACLKRGLDCDPPDHDMNHRDVNH